MAEPIIITTTRHKYTVNPHINNMIGRGGFGCVYAGYNEKNSKIAAKCVIEDSYINIAKIVKEGSRLLQLNHKNIVKVYDVKNEGRMVWILMEYCADRDLQHFLRTNTQTLDQKLKIMIQIATGIEYLHEQNVVHRDIKPANILMSGGTAKLTGKKYKSCAKSVQ